MGDPRNPYLDPPAIYPTSMHSPFVAVGLGYVCCSLGFIVFAITSSVEFGTKSFQYELLKSAVGYAAMVLIVVGVSLLIAFLFHLASRPLQPFSGETSPSGDLWDEQLDG
jgi:TRAP-type C4-dicarboxylate transport system permease small subunit